MRPSPVAAKRKQLRASLLLRNLRQSLLLQSRRLRNLLPQNLLHPSPVQPSLPSRPNLLPQNRQHRSPRSLQSLPLQNRQHRSRARRSLAQRSLPQVARLRVLCRVLCPSRADVRV